MKDPFEVIAELAQKLTSEQERSAGLQADLESTERDVRALIAKIDIAKERFKEIFDITHKGVNAPTNSPEYGEQLYNEEMEIRDIAEQAMFEIRNQS